MVYYNMTNYLTKTATATATEAAGTAPTTPLVTALPQMLRVMTMLGAAKREQLCGAYHRPLSPLTGILDLRPDQINKVESEK